MINDANNEGTDNSEKPSIRKPRTKKTPSERETNIKRSKYFDGFLAKEGDFISKSDSGAFGRSKVKFDGSTERSGANEQQIKDRIGSCREAYENVGIIGNIIDLMTDFGIEGIEIYHPSKQIEKFFKQWAKKVALRDLSEQILKCIYRDGNVPILSSTGRISDAEAEKFKRSFGKKSSNDHLFEDKTLQGSKIIPYKYRVLDVMNLRKTGNDIIGDYRWSYQYNKEECKDLAGKTNSDSVKNIKNSMTTEEWESFIKTGLATLDPNRFNMLFYKKDGYRCWANPMLWRVIEDVKFKKQIRDMDISIAEGVTNVLTIVKLGDSKEGILPSKNKYNKMVNMLKNPSKSKTIVWDDLISVETEYPPVKDFFSAEKYKQVDDDIRSGLGIAEILINGGGGNYSNSFLSVKTLLERLETGRQQLLDFITEQVEIVTKNMGFRSGPHVRLVNMSLTNEEIQKKFMLELFDRNALSYETLIARFGENIEIESSRMIEEDKKRDAIKEESPFALLRVGKFGPQYPTGPPGISELLEPKENLPSAQEQNGKDGGSPTGPKNRPKVVEPTNPVGQAATKIIFTKKEIDQAFEHTYTSAKICVCEDKSYSDARFMKNEDLDEVMDILVENIVPAMIYVKYSDNIDEINKTNVPSQINDMIQKSINNQVNDFVSLNGRRPPKDKLKEITQKAFALCKNPTN